MCCLNVQMQKREELVQDVIVGSFRASSSCPKDVLILPPPWSLSRTQVDSVPASLGAGLACALLAAACFVLLARRRAAPGGPAAAVDSAVMIEMASTLAYPDDSTSSGHAFGQHGASGQLQPTAVTSAHATTAVAAARPGAVARRQRAIVVCGAALHLALLMLHGAQLSTRLGW